MILQGKSNAFSLLKQCFYWRETFYLK